MLKIRLTRRGKRNNAFYRLVVAEQTSPIKGRFIEVLGFLNPHSKEKNLKVDRIKYWIGKGAQCSDTVHNLLVSAGILGGPKRAIKMKSSSAEASADEKKPVEEKKEEAAAPAPVEGAKTEEKVEEKPVEKAPAEMKPETEDQPKEQEKAEEKEAEKQESA